MRSLFDFIQERVNAYKSDVRLTQRKPDAAASAKQ
jgi:hypothetical protein